MFALLGDIILGEFEWEWHVSDLGRGELFHRNGNNSAPANGISLVEPLNLDPGFLTGGQPAPL